MKTATFTWSATVEVVGNFDDTNEEQVANARHDAYMQIQESDGELTNEGEDDTGEDDGEVCPECGNYTLMPAMFTGVGKAMTEGFRCPDPACGYNS